MILKRGIVLPNQGEFPRFVMYIFFQLKVRASGNDVLHYTHMAHVRLSVSRSNFCIFELEDQQLITCQGR